MGRGFLAMMAVVACLFSPVLADDPKPSPDDVETLNGMSRAEILSILGPPTKMKEVSGGGRVLTYKLLRLREGVESSPDLLLLDVPGVGLVGRRPKDLDSLAGQTVSIEPTWVDDEGRPISGGVETTSTTSVSWDTETGKVTRPDSKSATPTAGKIKLKLVLNRDDVVVDWSTSPKQRGRQP